VGVQKEIATDILHHIPFRYITMPLPQHILLLYEKVLPLINIHKSTFLSSTRMKRMWGGVSEGVN
jgi:hypothetical protein